MPPFTFALQYLHQHLFSKFKTSSSGDSNPPASWQGFLLRSLPAVDKNRWHSKFCVAGNIAPWRISVGWRQNLCLASWSLTRWSQVRALWPHFHSRCLYSRCSGGHFISSKPAATMLALRGQSVARLRHDEMSQRTPMCRRFPHQLYSSSTLCLPIFIYWCAHDLILHTPGPSFTKQDHWVSWTGLVWS